MISHGKKYLPCSGMDVALFLVSLLNDKVSASVMSSYIYSIKYMHQLYAMHDPTVHPYVKSLLESCKRCNVKGVSKKDPVTSAQIRELFIMYIGSDDLVIVRDLAIIVLCFSAFLRYDEISNLKCGHVIFEDKHMSLYIEKSLMIKRNVENFKYKLVH